MIDDRTAQRIMQEAAVLIGIRDNTQIQIRHKACECRESVDIAPMMDDLVSTEHFHHPAHAVCPELGLFHRHIQRRTQKHIRLMKLLHGCLTDQALTVQLSVIQMELNPAQHILRTGIDCSGRSKGCADSLGLILNTGMIKRNLLQAVHSVPAFRPIIWCRMVRIVLNVIDPAVGPLHPQRAEQILLQALLIGLACHLLHDIPCQNISIIVILELGPKRLVRLQITQMLHQLFSGKIRAVPGVLMPRNSGSVAQKIAKRTILRRKAVIELHLRHVLADGRIPGKLALIDHDGNQRRCKSLGTAADLIHRLSVCRKSLRRIPAAVSFAQDDLAVMNHADRNRRCVPELQPLFCLFTKFFYKLLIHHRDPSSVFLVNTIGFSPGSVPSVADTLTISPAPEVPNVRISPGGISPTVPSVANES